MADSRESKRAVKRKAKLEARKQKQVLNCVLWKPFPSNTIDLLWFFTTSVLKYSAVVLLFELINFYELRESMLGDILFSYSYFTLIFIYLF